MTKTVLTFRGLSLLILVMLLCSRAEAQNNKNFEAARPEQEAKTAQADSAVNLPNFLLPRFTRSIVKLKSGEVYTAVLNYNTVDQQMFFRQVDNKFYILDEPQLIDTVFMANRIFVPAEKGFYEVAVNGIVTLFIQHKCYAEFEGTPTLYGAKSQTISSTSVSRIYGARGPMDLKVADGYKIYNDSKYWIRKDNKMNIFETKRQFLKIFPDKEKELSQFISKNKTDFQIPLKVVELANYCNELYK